jgi:hypothetical protein
MALHSAPPEWHDGSADQMAALITGGDPFAGPPWRNEQVSAAIGAVLDANGVPSPILAP